MAKEQLTIEIDADNKASRAFRRLTGQLRDLGSVARRAGSIMAGAMAAGAAAATAAVAAFTKSVIDVGSESEQARIRLDSLFGSAEEGAEAFDAVREAAARLPFTFSEILGISSTLSVISDDADELQTRIMQAAEISARFGISLQETAGNMVRFFTAGASSADLFRERGVLAAIGVQAGMQTSVEESIRLWNGFFRRIEEQGSSATDRLAESFQGIVSMLQDLWREFRQTVADAGVFDAVKEELEELRKRLSGFIDSGAAARFARSFADMISAVLGALGDALFTMAGALGTDAGEAFRNLGIILGSRLGQGIFLGLEKVFRETNLASKIPGPVGELFDRINLAALGARELSEVARDSAEEAAAALRILADAGTGVEGLVEKLKADLTMDGGGAGAGAGGGGGGSGATRPAVVDSFLRSFGIPSVDEIRRALQQRFDMLRRLGAAPVPPGMTRQQAAFGPDPTAPSVVDEFIARGGTGQELFGGAGKAGERVADTMTQGMGDLMEDAGKNAIRSLIDGMLQGTQDFGDFMKNIILSFMKQTVIGAIFNALEIQSPSGVGRRAGQSLGMGFALGIQDTFDFVGRTVRGLAREAIPNVGGPQLRALGATAAAGPVSVGPSIDPSSLQPLSRWAVAHDPAFQDLLAASDQVGRQTGRIQ